jgi:hypothetical protein
MLTVQRIGSSGCHWCNCVAPTIARMPARIASGNVDHVRINCTSSGCFSISGDKSGDKRESVDGVSAGCLVCCKSAGTDCKSVIRRFESDLGLFRLANHIPGEQHGIDEPQNAGSWRCASVDVGHSPGHSRAQSCGGCGACQLAKGDIETDLIKAGTKLYNGSDLI